MAATEIGDLNMQLRATADRLAADIKKGVDAAKKPISVQAIALGTALGQGIAAGAAKAMQALSMIGENVKASFDEVRKVTQSAEAMGVSTAWLSGMRSATRQMGGEADKLGEAFMTVFERISEAAMDASGDAGESFKLLNLDVMELRKLAPEKQIQAVFDAMRKVGEKSAQIFIARNLGSDSGGDAMLQILNAGDAKLKDMIKSAEAYGTIIRGDAVAATRQWDSAVGLVSESWKGFGLALGAEVAPLIQTIGEYTKDAVTQAGGMKPVVDGWGESVASFLDGELKALTDGWKATKKEVSLMGAAGSVAVAGLNVPLQLTLDTLKDIGKEIGKIDFATPFREAKEYFEEFKSAGSRLMDKLEPARVEDRARNEAFKAKMRAVETDADYSYSQGPPDMRGVNMELPAGSGPTDGILLGELLPPESYAATNAAIENLKQTWEQAGKDINAVTEEAQSENFSILEEYRKKRAEALANEGQGQVTGVQRLHDMALAHQEENNKKLKAAADKAAKEEMQRYTELGEFINAKLQQQEDAREREIQKFRDANNDAVSSMVTSWINGTETIASIVQRWSNRMVENMVEVMLFSQQTGLLTAGLGELGKMSGAWGSIFKGVAGAFTGVAGTRAEGGTMYAGQPYLVGEQGPEIVSPGKTSMVTPNDIFGKLGKSRSGEAAQPIIINNQYSSGVQKSELAPLADEIMERTVSAVLENVRGGGGYRRGLQS
jgi:hypothetical protein